MNRKVVSLGLVILLMGLLLPGCAQGQINEPKAQITELEEENTQLQKEIDEVEAEAPTATTAPGGLSYDELIEFMREDTTNKETHLVSGMYAHGTYAQIFLGRARENGIEGCLVTIQIEEGETWFFTGFETTDKGWIYILPALDREVKLEVGKKYHELNNFSPFGVDDTIVEITIHIKEQDAVEGGIKYGKIDGSIDDWPSGIAMTSDPAKDLIGDAESERGVDLKAVQAFMNEDYLYVAIQIRDVFDLSLLRNYFIAVDGDKDGQDEYQFGVRPSGFTWVFDHTTYVNNLISESAFEVAACGKTNVI